MSEPVMDREVRRRLADLRHVEEVTGNVSMTCRYFGISRPTYYTWLNRYEKDGVDGLRDRSKRPRHSPNATRADVVEKIVHLRTNYHFGPEKIAMYLQRYHDVTISKSGVWRILHRLDLGRLPSSQRYKRHDRRWTRYEKQRPVHHVQIDVKFVEPLPGKTAASSVKAADMPVGRRGKFYQFTAIDDCTRLRVLRVYPRNNQKTAIQFFDYVLSQLPFAVDTIQTDDGANPRTPRLNGKAEPSHRIDAERFYRLLDGVVIDDVNVFNTKLKSGRTTATTTDPTAASVARPAMKDSDRRHKPRPACSQSLSAAHK